MELAKEMKNPIVIGTGISPRVTTSRTYSAMYEDWLLKREWCDQQGWHFGIDYWPPGALDGVWHFRKQANAVLFALRWA